MIYFHVEGVFRDRAGWVEQEIIRCSCARNVRRSVLMIQIQNVGARLVYVAQRNEIVGVGNSRGRVLDGLRVCGKIVASRGQLEIRNGIDIGQPLPRALPGVVRKEEGLRLMS